MLKAQTILADIKNDPRLSPYVDFNLPLPQPYQGRADIKLIVLGQDPTIRNQSQREKITTVLNLDRRGSLTAYLTQLCAALGLGLDNIYATNLYKNFFIDPPTEIREVDIFSAFAPYWMPLLQEELAPFSHAPVITLGEPILTPLASPKIKVNDSWGYTPHWKSDGIKTFRYIRPEDNHLNRVLFPFPHQPGARKAFYRLVWDKYTAFVKATAFPA